MEAKDSQIQLGATLEGKYHLIGELGAGGFGRVYLAKHLQLGINVAIKVAHGTRNPRALHREARLAAGLSSPFSVRIFDVGCAADATPYIVMEHLQGCTLRQYLADNGSVSPALATRWATEICAALHEAHSKGLIHRDLKPANLFLIEGADQQLHVKLVDFGLAKPLHGGSDESGSDSTVVAGTPAYMAPERLRANHTTVAADIWSLGIVLFEMLSGVRPFEGKTNAATLAAIVADPPRSLGDFVTDVPEALDVTIARCLRKHPNERFRSVAEVAEALRASPPDVRSAVVRLPSRETEPSTVVTASVSLAHAPARVRDRSQVYLIGVGLVALVSALVAFNTGTAPESKVFASKSAPSGAPTAVAASFTEPPIRSLEAATEEPNSPPSLPAAPITGPDAPSARVRNVSPRRPVSSLPGPAPSSINPKPAPRGLILEPEF